MQEKIKRNSNESRQSVDMLGRTAELVVKSGEPKHPVVQDSLSRLVSVIIPARDEANSIGSLLPEIEKILSGYNHEVIVVDDGSRDKTAEIARYNGTIVISHEENRGKGAAMKTGVRGAKGDIIVFLDGDGAHNPKDILRVIDPILTEKADVIIGSRALSDSEVPSSPARRRLSNSLASFVLSALISILMPLATLFKRPMRRIKVTDCTSGFRAIKKETWHKLDLNSQRFEIETEMIYEAAKRGFTIAEVPIRGDPFYVLLGKEFPPDVPLNKLLTCTLIEQTSIMNTCLFT